MKWVTLLLLSLTAISCAHHFHPERATASYEEERELRRSNIEPLGGRY